jgi:sigma-B regulation protein RsbU (phosphoserine phosphatase)
MRCANQKGVEPYVSFPSDDGIKCGTACVTGSSMYRSLKKTIAALTGGEESEREFSLAAERIQRALLDIALPQIANLDIGVKAEPSRLVGGDYVDLFVPDEQSLVFGLGDASGKSLAAALNALMLRYLVRGLVRVLGRDNLLAIVTHTNEVVTEDMTDGSFITFLLGAIDTESGALRIVNAGHEPALILRRNADVAYSMDASGIVLGITTEPSFSEQNTSLSPGDLALFFTDGLTEATNNKGELYTVERLRQAFVAARALSSQDLADSIFATVKAYSDGSFRDDATVLVIRRPREMVVNS